MQPQCGTWTTFTEEGTESVLFRKGPYDHRSFRDIPNSLVLFDLFQREIEKSQIPGIPIIRTTFQRALYMVCPFFLKSLNKDIPGSRTFLSSGFEKNAAANLVMKDFACVYLGAQKPKRPQKHKHPTSTLHSGGKVHYKGGYQKS